MGIRSFCSVGAGPVSGPSHAGLRLQPPWVHRQNCGPFRGLLDPDFLNKLGLARFSIGGLFEHA